MLTIRHILVPTDLSEPAERALECALDLAVQRLGRAVLGSVTDAVVRTAPVPVLTVRGGTTSR